nr:hypothetical protein [Pantoea rodasii]
MSDALQRWLTLSLRWRLATLLAVALLLMMLAWMMLMRPQQRALDLLLRQQEERAQQVRQRQQQLAARPTISVLEQEIAHLQQPAAEIIGQSTLEALITARGNQLESWLPDTQPQQLQLRLGWGNFSRCSLSWR